MKELAIGKWTIKKITQILSENGDLGYFQSGFEIDFDIKRVYFSFNVPAQSSRGNHAHKKLKQAIIALGGVLQIELESALKKETIYLQPQNEILVLEGVVWRKIHFETLETICLVGASESYDETDYIRNYEEFLTLSKDLLNDHSIL